MPYDGVKVPAPRSSRRDTENRIGSIIEYDFIRTPLGVLTIFRLDYSLFACHCETVTDVTVVAIRIPGGQLCFVHRTNPM